MSVTLTTCCNLPTQDEEGIPYCEGIRYGCLYCDKPLCYRMVAGWIKLAANYSHPVCSDCKATEDKAESFGL